jgi:hypothetical protein
MLNFVAGCLVGSLIYIAARAWARGKSGCKPAPVDAAAKEGK